MEAVAAFSLAGTILQFLDTGSRFINLAISLHNRGQDQVDESTNEITHDLDRIVKDLQSQGFSNPDSTASNNGQDNGLHRLVKHCGEVAEELLGNLCEHQVHDQRRKRDALKLALKRVWNDKKIAELRERLDGFRNQINVHLLVLLR